MWFRLTKLTSLRLRRTAGDELASDGELIQLQAHDAKSFSAAYYPASLSQLHSLLAGSSDSHDVIAGPR
jgi:hypothetical protein